MKEPFSGRESGKVYHLPVKSKTKIPAGGRGTYLSGSSPNPASMSTKG